MKRDANRFDDLFHHFGRIAVRRMFGGEGIYARDTMFGLVVDDRIYFKVDDATRPVYAAEDCAPFTYMKEGKRTSLSYYAIPDRLYDDPDALAAWARAALAAALEKSKSKPKPKKKSVAKRKKAKT